MTPKTLPNFYIIWHDLLLLYCGIHSSICLQIEPLYVHTTRSQGFYSMHAFHDIFLERGKIILFCINIIDMFSITCWLPFYLHFSKDKLKPFRTLYITCRSELKCGHKHSFLVMGKPLIWKTGMLGLVSVGMWLQLQHFLVF